ncbi:hypothetical protein HB779_16715 [Phyllobacterium sp. 628]|uniref:hypothetical protein n=1 Tax=Phyllobacterium sp. 628 TaxID=2718938 RepID=UPI00166222E9|nr:hypothetical protein [Phyllobacterium sp. 628]QND53345.1 hypothetical protein HB779_16715 [Phyllobacterium sp. 628]
MGNTNSIALFLGSLRAICSANTPSNVEKMSLVRFRQQAVSDDDLFSALYNPPHNHCAWFDKLTMREMEGCRNLNSATLAMSIATRPSPSW